jgi:hypothetical protein
VLAALLGFLVALGARDVYQAVRGRAAPEVEARPAR